MFVFLDVIIWFVLKLVRRKFFVVIEGVGGVIMVVFVVCSKVFIIKKVNESNDGLVCWIILSMVLIFLIVLFVWVKVYFIVVMIVKWWL